MSKEIVTLSIKLDKEFHKKVKLFSVEQEVSIKDMFIKCMERMMAEAEEEKKQATK